MNIYELIEKGENLLFENVILFYFLLIQNKINSNKKIKKKIPYNEKENQNEYNNLKSIV